MSSNETTKFMEAKREAAKEKCIEEAEEKMNEHEGEFEADREREKEYYSYMRRNVELELRNRLKIMENRLKSIEEKLDNLADTNSINLIKQMKKSVKHGVPKSECAQNILDSLLFASVAVAIIIIAGILFIP